MHCINVFIRKNSKIIFTWLHIIYNLNTKLIVSRGINENCVPNQKRNYFYLLIKFQNLNVMLCGYSQQSYLIPCFWISGCSSTPWISDLKWHNSITIHPPRVGNSKQQLRCGGVFSALTIIKFQGGNHRVYNGKSSQLQVQGFTSDDEEERWQQGGQMATTATKATFWGGVKNTVWFMSRAAWDKEQLFRKYRFSFTIIKHRRDCLLDHVWYFPHNEHM